MFTPQLYVRKVSERIHVRRVVPGLRVEPIETGCELLPDPDNPLLRIKDCQEKLRLLKAGKLGPSWRERQRAGNVGDVTGMAIWN